MSVDDVDALRVLRTPLSQSVGYRGSTHLICLLFRHIVEDAPQVSSFQSINLSITIHMLLFLSATWSLQSTQSRSRVSGRLASCTSSGMYVYKRRYEKWADEMLSVLRPHELSKSSFA